LESGVSVHCRQVLGACHGIEIFPVICPDIARTTTSDIANFVIGWAFSIFPEESHRDLPSHVNDEAAAMNGWECSAGRITTRNAARDEVSLVLQVGV
jgi:hypothetical protein